MAEQNDALKRCNALATAISKIVECPVCLESVNTPFKQCTRGHVFCSECVTTLTCCPTCKGHIITDTPVVLRNLLESLPKLCRYADNGCSDVIEPGNDHETFCGYRLVACRVEDCGENVTVCQLLEHYETKHIKRYVVKSETVEVKWLYCTPNDGPKDKVPVYIFNTFFWLNVSNISRAKQLQVSFEALPIGKPEYKYYAKVTFGGGNHIYSSTLEASVKTPSVKHGKGEIQDRSNSDDGDIMTVSYRFLYRMLENDEEPVYNMKLFREKVSKRV